MANVVLKVSETIMQEIKNNYKEHLQAKLPPGSTFTVKTPFCTITAYKSGKIMFQGKSAEQEAAKWISYDLTAGSNPKKPKKTTAYSIPNNIEQLSFIGSDEVGTGDYFGPITVAAAFCETNKLALLKELGVQDSKNLKDKAIIEIAKNILSVIPYSLLILDNKKYNNLQKQGMNQGKMKALLHNKALLHLLKKLEGQEYDGILIDQFVQPDAYFKYIADQHEQVKDKVYFETKAEQVHLSVAAASIIARYAFLKEMDKLSQTVGTTLPKGAGAHVDLVAAQLIDTKGEGILYHTTKLHFANTDKAKTLYKRKQL
ncbi:ribonuclease HIII [Bacillus taeanensis]|uniref:Ribonuclease HIII n=1 Tax=Bacillus taeanensis TaxID=273032 RepID=A0A366Y106_9BACI|nr:ribonuclease HIII [Bacillus taeanensis]RBW71526.1 ribonuclease HIII [Bacillus taeanensis]